MMAESADPYTSNDVGGMQQPSLNVSSIMRRKAEREQQPGGVSNPTYDAAAASAYQPSSENNTVSYEKMMQAQMAFLRTDLMLAIALPFTLLLYVSGIAGLFSLTFGGMLCYLLDLIGSVEVSFIFVAICIYASCEFTDLD